MPDLTTSVGAPRVVGIEYPLGRTFGQPGDFDCQAGVLRATLHALESMTVPGSVTHLPNEWPESPKQVENDPPEPPPIAKYLTRHPLQLLRLLRRDVPADAAGRSELVGQAGQV